MRIHSGAFRSRHASRTFLISAWCEGVDPPITWWQPMHVCSAGMPGSLDTATEEWQYRQGIWS